MEEKELEVAKLQKEIKAMKEAELKGLEKKLLALEKGEHVSLLDTVRIFPNHPQRKYILFDNVIFISLIASVLVLLILVFPLFNPLFITFYGGIIESYLNTLFNYVHQMEGAGVQTIWELFFWLLVVFSFMVLGIVIIFFAMLVQGIFFCSILVLIALYAISKIKQRIGVPIKRTQVQRYIRFGIMIGGFLLALIFLPYFLQQLDFQIQNVGAIYEGMEEFRMFGYLTSTLFLYIYYIISMYALISAIFGYLFGGIVDTIFLEYRNTKSIELVRVPLEWSWEGE